MKIAIIGAGFYGCNLAIDLKNKFNKNVEITIFEKNEKILSGAINNNQHRLHLGFHYPRCDKTIQQSFRTFEKFLNDYADCTVDCQNYYLVHKDSNVNFDFYKKQFEKFSIPFEICSKKQLKDNVIVEDIEGVVRCGEKVIVLKKLVQKIKDKIIRNNIKVLLNTKIEDDSMLNDFDFVINCTYNNPNLLIKNKIKTKSELCFIPILKDQKGIYKNQSFTIMDGHFSSIYQTGSKDRVSISNVVKTPYYKSEDPNELEEIKKRLTKKEIVIISKEIIKESTKFFYNLDQLEIDDCYVCLKTKIFNDKNDFRGSFLLKEENAISMFCGKVSCYYDVKDEILNLLNERL